MPSSHFYQLNEIVELIILTKPSSILDIGIGFGKYGFLCREYLDLIGGNRNLYKWEHRIDGIEIFPRYITPLQKKIYDNIYLGNALEILPKMVRRYDLILLIDVIEHFNFSDGQKLLHLCLRCGKNIIISTPRIDLPQTAVYGNSYETHRSFYRKCDFKKFPDKIFIFNFFSLIVYLGEQASSIQKTLFKRRFLITWPMRLGFGKLVKKRVLKMTKRAINHGSEIDE